MKKPAIIVIIILLFCFVGCGSGGNHASVEEARDTENEFEAENLHDFKVYCLWYNTYDPDGIELEGSIKNNTDSNYHNVKIYLTVKDANNTLLGVASGLLEPADFAPGQLARFTATVPDVVCTTDTLKLSYRLEEI